MGGYIVYVDSGVISGKIRKRYSDNGEFVGFVLGIYEPVKYRLISL